MQENNGTVPNMQPCARCGKPVPPSEQWCPHCGGIQIRNSASPAMPPAGSRTVRAERTTHTGVKITLGACLLLLVMAGAVAFWYMKLRNNGVSAPAPITALAPEVATTKPAEDEMAWDSFDWSGTGEYIPTYAWKDSAIYAEPTKKSKVLGNVKCPEDLLDVTVDRVRVLKSGSTSEDITIYDAWWHVREPFEGWLEKNQVGLADSSFLYSLYGFDEGDDDEAYEEDVSTGQPAGTKAAEKNENPANQLSNQSKSTLTVKVTANTLNVRSGPSQKYSALDQIKRNQTVQTEAYAPDEEKGNKSPGWYRITLQNGKQGWISSEHVVEVVPALEGNALITAIQSGYLKPYTAAEGYPCIKEAFEHFFERPSWNLSSQQNQIIFKAVVRLRDNRGTRISIVFERSDKRGITVEAIFLNDDMAYSAAEDRLPGAQSIANHAIGMNELMYGDTSKGLKLYGKKYHNTIDLQEFLALVYLSR